MRLGLEGVGCLGCGRCLDGVGRSSSFGAIVPLPQTLLPFLLQPWGGLVVCGGWEGRVMDRDLAGFGFGVKKGALVLTRLF